MAMKQISSYVAHALAGLSVVVLVACTGEQIGLTELKAVNPTEPLATLEHSSGPADDVNGVANELVRNYQEYTALYSAVEKERPTTENTCFELKEKIAKVKPLLEKQETVLVGTDKLYVQLTALREGDPRIQHASEAGKAHVAKARERVNEYVALAEITDSFTSDCPTEGEMFMHIMTGFSALNAIPQYEAAKAKAPLFNQSARQLEKLSAEERELAYGVVRSLNALTAFGGGTFDPSAQ